jgi:putative metalloprotease
MLKILPLLLMVAYAALMLRFSVWQTRRQLDANSRPLRDPALMAVTDRLARALDLPSVPVHVFEVDAVNGLAAPDGRIFLTRGFLNRHARGEVTSEEIAAVIAHELGHVALGHSKRRMIDFTGQNAVFMMLGAVLNRFIPVFGILIANTLARLLMARLSRRDEFEADAYATALLLKAGFGTAPQKSLFRKLAALTGGAAGPGGAPAWTLTHPPAADRIAAIEANEGRWLA